MIFTSITWHLIETKNFLLTRKTTRPLNATHCMITISLGNLSFANYFPYVDSLIHCQGQVEVEPVYDCISRVLSPKQAIPANL